VDSTDDRSTIFPTSTSTSRGRDNQKPAGRVLDSSDRMLDSSDRVLDSSDRMLDSSDGIVIRIT
jgi:hypothetical protein